MKTPYFRPIRLFSQGSYPYLLLASLVLTVSSPVLTQAQTLPPPPPVRVPKAPPKAAPVPPTSVPMTTPSPVEVPVSEKVFTAPSAEVSAPPPKVSVEPSSGNSTVREFTFQAPSDNSTASTSTINISSPSPSTSNPSTVNARFYRVEVSATDEEILEQVKAIEPFAFWEKEQQIVYAGRFHQKDQAQQRVQELTEKGLSAQIVPVSQ